MQGLLLVDKPKGWTSFDCVNYVRKIVAQSEGVKPKNIKVGHSGTLDPFATGLLILLIGNSYTKKASEFLKSDKVYEATIKLGYKSTTLDSDGEITAEKKPSVPSQEDIEQVLAILEGVRKQTPPAYSALKIKGERAYSLARRGINVELEPREVNIYYLKLLDYAYPLLKVRAKVSSGTYMRVLAEEIGRELKTWSYCSELRRVKSGKYRVSDALSLKGAEMSNVSIAIKSLQN